MVSEVAQIKSAFFSVVGLMKKEKLLLLVIILLSLALRITNLKTFPPFVDETVYFHWAKEVQKGDLFFTYVLDDRQPLFVWLLALLQMIIKSNCLVKSQLKFWILVCLIFFLNTLLATESPAIDFDTDLEV